MGRERIIKKQSARVGTSGSGAVTLAVWDPSTVFLKGCIYTLLVASVVGMAALRWLVPEQLFRLSAPAMVCVFALIGAVLLRFGNPRASVWVLIAGIWCVMATTAFFTGGTRAPVILSFPVLILVAAWTVGASAAVAITILSALVSLTFYGVERWGALPGDTPSTLEIYTGDQIVIFFMTSAVALFITQAYRVQLATLRRTTSELTSRAHELEINKTELHQAQSVGKVGSWVFDIPADSVRLTVQASRMLCPVGAWPEQTSYTDGTTVTGAQLFISVATEDRDLVRSAWSAALAGGVFDLEHRVLQGSELRWLRHIAQVEMDAAGRPFHAIGTLQDITERKQAEHALRESEFLWKFAVEGARDGVWDWDLQTDAMQFSMRWREIMGYAPDDAVPDGKARALQIHPDDRARVKEVLDAYLSGESDVYAVEARFAGKDGTYRWVLGRGMVVSRDANGEPVRMIGTTTDISERKRMEEQVQHLAFYDALTNLPNRRLLKDRMQQAMSASKRLGTYCALMFLDLDNFKPLNDVYGHDAGDLLLVEVAQRIKHCVREVDSVARFGGDEFVVMLVELSTQGDESLAHAKQVAEKVREALAQPYTVPLKSAAKGRSAVTHHCTVSVGAVLFLGHEQSHDEVLKRADQAMYQAKEQGRNQVHFQT